MSVFDRSLDYPNWSDDLRGLIRRRLCECGGVLLIALALTMAVALATWSVQDPSLSHATDAPVRNLLGTPGAIGADLLMQLFGLASTVLVLPVAIWGWRIATHRPLDREGLRLGFWVLGTLLASGFASCLPHSAAWPLPSGLGGVFGDAILYVPSALFGPLSSVAYAGIGAVLGAAALVSATIAAGFGYRDPNSVALDERWAREAAGPEDNDEERAAISLGWLTHAFLSLKARLHRLIARRSPQHVQLRRAPTPVVSERDRFEPRADRAAEDTIEPDDEDIADEPAPAPRRTPRAAAISCPRWRFWLRRNRPTGSRQVRPRSRRPRHSSKACCRTSAYAARSSMRARARSSRSTNSSLRPASSRRASSGSPTTLRVP
jgi:DNA segregation ATPase FtsK/SpoIIIE, S-DNA-T family